jgi:hypothetical protein
MKKMKIWWYKIKLKKVYLNYRNSYYDCGSHMKNYISGDKDLVNYYISKLRALGENLNLIP